mmetsp:Transcript_111421/g.311432  ORF Transcript_111421/g.311432 Transcript_111421/m.311432 type:complete len:267 (+) Transcript_111421:959-1759(+)
MPEEGLDLIHHPLVAALRRRHTGTLHRSADGHDAEDREDVGDEGDDHHGPEEHAHGLDHAPQQDPDLLEPLGAQHADDTGETKCPQDREHPHAVLRVRRYAAKGEHPQRYDAGHDDEDGVKEFADVPSALRQTRNEAAIAVDDDPKEELDHEQNGEDMLRDLGAQGLGSLEDVVGLDADAEAIAEDHDGHDALEVLGPHKLDDYPRHPRGRRRHGEASGNSRREPSHVPRGVRRVLDVQRRLDGLAQEHRAVRAHRDVRIRQHALA